MLSINRTFRVCVALIFVLAILPGVARALPQAAATERLSVASDGTQGNGATNSPVISADGRYVAFYSFASNLVAEDTNEQDDVFVHDRKSGATVRVSVASNGTQAIGGQSEYPDISDDGRVVSFNSYATNLVADDSNGMFDIFVHDRTTGETTRVSVASDGTQANGNSYNASISGDGRYVAFESFASNLVKDDTNGKLDVFSYDRQTGETKLVSITAGGTQGDDSSVSPSVSYDGRYVAFESYATNLIPTDTNGSPDILVRDMQTGEIIRASVAYEAGQQPNLSSLAPAISADGRYVAFESFASNLVEGDTNEHVDIFVRDLTANLTRRVSLASDGSQSNEDSYLPAMSPDGSAVAFGSYADNLVSGDTNLVSDVFLHDLLSGETWRASVSSANIQGNDSSYMPVLSRAGRYAVFSSNASNLVADDTNDTSDTFVHGSTPWLGYSFWIPLVAK